jgi:hypothetical protein
MGCNCCSSAEPGDQVEYQYAAKTVCGIIKPEPSDIKPSNPLPAGQYFTKINIHNPSRCDCVTFRWKVAVGHSLEVGPISEFADATLCPDEALEIDCAAMRKRLGGQMPAHIEGWLVIYSPAPLDVVAVYGTAQSVGGAVDTFHTERVQPRCLKPCGDFDLDISTGVAFWEVAGPFAGAAPASAVFTEATLGPIDPNWASPVGALWIHPPGANVQAEGDYTYRLRFKLCSGFRDPRLNLAVLADYYENVFLNGSDSAHQVPPAQTGGPNWATPIVHPPTPSYTSNFKAGTNELLVIVTNKEKGTTGLAVHGSIEVESGLCPGEPMPLLKCPGVCYRLYTRELYFNQFIGFVIDQNAGAENFVCNGAPVGNSNGFYRAEQLDMALSGQIPPGTILKYQVFTRNLQGATVGWSAATSSGFCGLTGADDPITAVKIWLENSPIHCHVRYKVCTRRRLAQPDPNSQWSQDFYDGAVAGSTSGIGWPARYPPIVALTAEIVWL